MSNKDQRGDLDGFFEEIGKDIPDFDPVEPDMTPMTAEELKNCATSLVRLSVDLAHKTCDQRAIANSARTVEVAAKLFDDIDNGDGEGKVKLDTADLIKLIEGAKTND